MAARQFFAPVALSEILVTPRTNYGPRAMQLLVNNAVIYSGTMASNAPLDVKLSPPIYATNATLYVTSAYDLGSPNSPRNVQVAELNFFEVASPGTFAGWQLQNFSSAQLTNNSVCAAGADPDGDRISNLQEFIVVGNPLLADATNAALKALTLPVGQFGIQFRENNFLSGVARRFQSTGDLANWSDITPLSLLPVQTAGAVTTYQAVFPSPNSMQFFRLRYDVAQ